MRKDRIVLAGGESGAAEGIVERTGMEWRRDVAFRQYPIVDYECINPDAAPPQARFWRSFSVTVPIGLAFAAAVIGWKFRPVALASLGLLVAAAAFITVVCLIAVRFNPPKSRARAKGYACGFLACVAPIPFLWLFWRYG